MNRTLRNTLLAVSLCMPAAPLWALDTDAMLGGGLGGAVGAAIGSEVGGRDGAIVGSAIGAAAGTAITTDRPYYQPPRRVVEREVYYVPQREVYYYPAKPFPPGRALGHYKHKRKYRYDD
ncbi:MAG TPA: glycine zipper domain-containing protein [Candidatus Competibacteraceae bacterium]|nr:glycine zipper domain-containing protein [Candidatus Competibacteraceae bacterium]